MLTYERAWDLLSYESDGRLRSRRTGRLYSRGKSYRQITLDGRGYYIHRIVWLMHHGAFPPDGIDHINRDPSDNRIENLRAATDAENNQNKPSRGCTFDAFTGTYKAQIQLNGKNKHLGRFKTPEEAIGAYRAAKARLHPFAVVV